MNIPQAYIQILPADETTGGHPSNLFLKQMTAKTLTNPL